MTKLNDKEIEKLFKDINDEIRYAVIYTKGNFLFKGYPATFTPKYKHVKNTQDDYIVEFGYDTYNTSDFYVIERPLKPSAPTYTKEFNVRGGSNIEPVFQPCEILFEGNKYIVVRNSGGKEFARKRSRIIIRDIDTRTDVEKTKDDLSELVDRYETDFGIIDAIINNKIHGVTFTGNK